MFGRPNGSLKRLATLFRPARPTPEPEPPRAAVEHHALCLADLSRDALRALIGDLDTRSGAVGCAVFDGDAGVEGAAVIFAGNLERFHMLAAARTLRCRVVYVQDTVSWWYQGSDLVPDLADFCRHDLAREIGSRPALFFGQSSGAYAALAASTWFPGSTVVACAPQSFADARAKARFHFVGVRAMSAPDGLIDLRARLQASPDPDASRTVVIAASETGNPASAHYWMDYLHALRLADLDGLTVSIVNTDSHSVVHGRVNLFADLLGELAANLSAPAGHRTEITRGFLERTFAGV